MPLILQQILLPQIFKFPRSKILNSLATKIIYCTYIHQNTHFVIFFFLCFELLSSHFSPPSNIHPLRATNHHSSPLPPTEPLSTATWWRGNGLPPLLLAQLCFASCNLKLPPPPPYPTSKGGRPSSYCGEFFPLIFDI